jgi:CRP-like cAMP-binding protein
MADIKNIYHINFLKKVPLFSGLDNEYIKYFLQASKVKVYDKGKLLFLHGEPADTFHIVLDGWVKLFRQTIEGE